MRADDTKCPGLTTVYRSLESLVSQGLLVQEVVLGDGERRYEMVHPGEHHHHLVCEKCRKSVHLDECLVEQMRKTSAPNMALESKATCWSCLVSVRTATSPKPKALLASTSGTNQSITPGSKSF